MIGIIILWRGSWGNKKNSIFALVVFVAQLVEQLTLNQWVVGSNPPEDTFFILKKIKN